MLKALILTARGRSRPHRGPSVPIAPVPATPPFQPSHARRSPVGRRRAGRRVAVRDRADRRRGRSRAAGAAGRPAPLVTLALTRALFAEGRGCSRRARWIALSSPFIWRAWSRNAPQPIGVAGRDVRHGPDAQRPRGERSGPVAAARERGDVHRPEGSPSELQILNNQAIVHRLRGDLDEALSLQRRLLAAREASGDPATLAVTLNNIGVIQRERGDYRDALVSYQRSLATRNRGPPNTPARSTISAPSITLRATSRWRTATTREGWRA